MGHVLDWHNRRKHVIRPQYDNRLCVDVVGGHTESDTRIQAYTCNRTPAQALTQAFDLGSGLNGGPACGSSCRAVGETCCANGRSCGAGETCCGSVCMPTGADCCGNDTSCAPGTGTPCATEEAWQSWLCTATPLMLTNVKHVPKCRLEVLPVRKPGHEMPRAFGHVLQR
jgi:hypothetical protein